MLSLLQEYAGFSFLVQREERGLSQESNKFLEGGPLYLCGEPDILCSSALWWRNDLSRVEDARSACLFRWDQLIFSEAEETKEPDKNGNFPPRGPPTSLAEEEIRRTVDQVSLCVRLCVAGFLAFLTLCDV
jgi:hypothetical protein